MFQVFLSQQAVSSGEASALQTAQPGPKTQPATTSTPVVRTVASGGGGTPTGAAESISSLPEWLQYDNIYQSGFIKLFFVVFVYSIAV